MIFARVALRKHAQQRFSKNLERLVPKTSLIVSNLARVRQRGVGGRPNAAIQGCELSEQSERVGVAGNFIRFFRGFPLRKNQR